MGNSEKSKNRHSKLKKFFIYPSMICDVWEKRTLFYATTYPESIQADETINEEVKSQWPVDKNHVFYDSQMEYCDLFRSNQIYKK